MEIKITTNQTLTVLQVISWVIFIGLCIEAGGVIGNMFVTMLVTPRGAENFWSGSDYLSSLYQFDKGHFFVIVLIMAIVAVLKAIMFYLIVKLFLDRKVTVSQPFNTALRRFMVNQSFLALGIGFFSLYGSEYSVWLGKLGVAPVDLQLLHIAGADVWLFMAVVLFLIVQMVKKGIEIQTENDLTI